jgi:hypothetical protein
MKLPSPALVVATAALFVALGGTSYAVMSLPKNSVGSAQIRDGSISPKDLSAAAAKGQVGPKGAPGSAGAKGETGSAGTRGEAGRVGDTGLSSAKYVFDGNGNNIGDLIAVTSVLAIGSTYQVRIGSHIFLIDSNGNYQQTNDGLSFTGPNCDGEPISGIGVQVQVVRNSGDMYGVIQANVGGVMRGFERPPSSPVVIPTGTVIRYAYDCTVAMTTAGTWYGTNNLTPVALPTLVPPLTIGS